MEDKMGGGLKEVKHWGRGAVHGKNGQWNDKVNKETWSSGSQLMWKLRQSAWRKRIVDDEIGWVAEETHVLIPCSTPINIHADDSQTASVNQCSKNSIHKGLQQRGLLEVTSDSRTVKEQCKKCFFHFDQKVFRDGQCNIYSTLKCSDTFSDSKIETPTGKPLTRFSELETATQNSHRCLADGSAIAFLGQLHLHGNWAKSIYWWRPGFFCREKMCNCGIKSCFFLLLLSEFF